MSVHSSGSLAEKKPFPTDTHNTTKPQDQIEILLATTFNQTENQTPPLKAVNFLRFPRKQKIFSGKTNIILSEVPQTDGRCILQQNLSQNGSPSWERNRVHNWVRNILYVFICNLIKPKIFNDSPCSVQMFPPSLETDTFGVERRWKKISLCKYWYTHTSISVSGALLSMP